MIFRAKKSTRLLGGILIGGLVLLGLGGCNLLDGTAAMTILVYMDADNSLDSDAVDNMNQMEAVNMFGSDVNVIVLFDRAQYKSWSDTRLYKVEYDLGGVNNAEIVSTRLSSGDLGISATGSTELDMGDPKTLRSFVEWGKTAYPASKYALVLWDHGSGWRSQNLAYGAGGASRALASDDTSDTIMYTSQLGSALDANGLDVIAFDLCYGGMFEIAYELRNKARYMVGSEEVVPGAGYPYQEWLSAFAASANKDSADFYTTLVNAYGNCYINNTPGTTLAAYDLSKTDALMTALNNFSLALSTGITDANTRAAVKSALFNNTEDYFATGSDVGIDIYDMADQIASGSATAALAPNEASALKAAVTDMVLHETHSSLPGSYYYDGNENSHGIAIHLTVCETRSYAAPENEDLAYFADHASLQYLLDTSTLPSQLDNMGNWRVNHPAENIPAFVDAPGNKWVPNLSARSGLLYTLFYKTF